MNINGMVSGGWSFVAAAYLLTAIFIFSYAIYVIRGERTSR